MIHTARILVHPCRSTSFIPACAAPAHSFCYELVLRRCFGASPLITLDRATLVVDVRKKMMTFLLARLDSLIVGNSSMYCESCDCYEKSCPAEQTTSFHHPRQLVQRQGQHKTSQPRTGSTLLCARYRSPPWNHGIARTLRPPRRTHAALRCRT